MLTRPSSTQAESLKYLLSGNSFHVNNVIDWLTNSKDELVALMLNPNTNQEHMFRNAGAANVLHSFLEEIEKHTR
jgi:hypothetical protein